MTHVPNSILVETPAELGSTAESNPIAKLAAPERVREAYGGSGFSSATEMAAQSASPIRTG